VRELPHCRPPKDRGLSSSHPTRPHRPGSPSDPLGDETQVSMAVLWLLDTYRSARTGPLRTGRSHCPPPYLSGHYKSVLSSTAMTRRNTESAFRGNLHCTATLIRRRAAETPFVATLHLPTHCRLRGPEWIKSS